MFLFVLIAAKPQQKIKVILVWRKERNPNVSIVEVNSIENSDINEIAYKSKYTLIIMGNISGFHLFNKGKTLHISHFTFKKTNWVVQFVRFYSLSFPFFAMFIGKEIWNVFPSSINSIILTGLSKGPLRIRPISEWLLSIINRILIKCNIRAFRCFSTFLHSQNADSNGKGDEHRKFHCSTKTGIYCLIIPLSFQCRSNCV